MINSLKNSIQMKLKPNPLNDILEMMVYGV